MSMHNETIFEEVYISYAKAYGLYILEYDDSVCFPFDFKSSSYSDLLNLESSGNSEYSFFAVSMGPRMFTSPKILSLVPISLSSIANLFCMALKAFRTYISFIFESLALRYFRM